MLVKLGLETLKQSEGVGRPACKPGEYLFVMQSANLARAGFENYVTECDLSVAAQRHPCSAARGYDSGAVKLLHVGPNVK